MNNLINLLHPVVRRYMEENQNVSRPEQSEESRTYHQDRARKRREVRAARLRSAWTGAVADPVVGA